MTKKPSLISLLLLMPFASICAVLFTPALPEIRGFFQIPQSVAGNSMPVFFLGYALGNLIYGPIAKRHGRKYAIYFGSTITIVGSLIILVSKITLVWKLFLIGRFLSALGSSVGMKIAFTVIGDVFQGAQATKIVSIATLSFAVAPGLAIALGGLLTALFGWESCFYAIIIYSVAILGLAVFLPETAPFLDEAALNLKKIQKTYLHIVKNKTLVYSALIMGCCTSIIYLFSTLAPFLAIQRMHLSPEYYGLMNLIPPLGLIGGSFVSHFLSTSKSPIEVIKIGTKIAAGFVLAILILFSFAESIWILFLPIPFLYFGSSLIFNNASATAMHNVEDKSNGSAVMGFINMGFVSIAVLIGESIPSPSILLMPICFAILILGIYVLQRRLR
jgi:DHA1 family bicyclomycin/chloramphenicol resistance-like MFS transporter